MKNAMGAPVRRSTPHNVPKRTEDVGYNHKSKSELCFPIIRTSGPKSEPLMSDRKDAKGKASQK